MAYEPQHIIISRCQRCGQLVTRVEEDGNAYIHNVDGLIWEPKLQMRICRSCRNEWKMVLDQQNTKVDEFKQGM